MPRLNLNYLGGLLPMEAPPSPTGPPGIDRRQNGLFGQHLKQASQMACGLVGVDRLPGPEPGRTQHDGASSRSDSPARPPNGVATQDPGPSGEPDDQATATKPRSERDQETTPPEGSSDTQKEAGAGQSGSPAGPGDEASESTSASGEEDDGAEKVSQTDGAQSAGKPSGQGGDSGANSTLERSGAGLQGGSKAAETVQGKDRSPSSGQLPDEGLEQSGRADASPADGPEPTGARAGENAVGEAAGQGGQMTAAESALGGGNSDGPKARDSRPSDGSTHRPRSASDARGAGSKDLVTGSPGDNPLTEAAPNVGPAATGRKPGADLQAVLPNELKAAAGKTTADSTSSGPGDGQTAGPARVASNQGSRQASASPSEGPSGPDQADRVRFVHRVARAFQSLGDRGGSVRLRLHPPELGSLRLELTVRNGTMAARLEVETTSARNMLLDHLPALRERLAGQDIKVGRFEVDLSDQSPGGSPQGPSDHPQSNDHFNGDVPGSPPDQKGEADPPAQPRKTVQTGEANRLDVIV